MGLGHKKSSAGIMYNHFFKKRFIYVLILFFLAALGLRCCTWAFSSQGSRGYPSLGFMGFSLWWLLLLQSRGSWASVVAMHGAQQLQLAGSGALTHQLWRTGLVAPRHVGSSRPRIKPVSLTLQGGFLTTGPPGKPHEQLLWWQILHASIACDPWLPVSRGGEFPLDIC